MRTNRLPALRHFAVHCGNFMGKELNVYSGLDIPREVLPEAVNRNKPSSQIFGKPFLHVKQGHRSCLVDALEILFVRRVHNSCCRGGCEVLKIESPHQARSKVRRRCCRLNDCLQRINEPPELSPLLSDKLLAELCKENKLSLTDRVNIEAYVARVRAEKLSVGEVLPARIGWKRSQGVQGPGPLHDISQRRQIRLLHSWLPSRPKPGAATSLTFCMQRTRALAGTCSRACS